MKSKFVREGLKDAFFADLEIVRRLPVDAVREAATAFLKDPEHDRDEVLADIATRHGVTIRDLIAAVRLIGSVMTWVTKEDDSVAAVAADLVELGKLDSPDDFVEKVNCFDARLQAKLRQERSQKEAVGGAFPTLSHLHTRCSITFSYDPEFSPTDDDPDKYVPTIAAAFPVTLIQIDTDSFGKKDMFSFAVTERELDELLRHLQLAKVQMKIAGKSIPSSGE